MQKDIIISSIWELPFEAISIQSETGEVLANVIIDAGGSVAVSYATKGVEEDPDVRGAVCKAIAQLTVYYSENGGLAERREDLLKVTKVLADTVTRKDRG